MRDNVCVLIVTYGERRHLLSEVVDRLFTMGCSNIIIVDNDSKNIHAKYLEYLSQDKRIHMIHNYDNLGSSGGIYVGINYFLTTGIKYLWILDDDNLPEPDSLNLLIQYSEKISMEKFALHSVRISSQGTYSIFNSSRSSFIEFDVLNAIYRVKKFFERKSRGIKNLPDVKYMKYAPYGGLFISRDLLNIVGLPNKSFFLYVDDTEFTSRIYLLGGCVIYVNSSKIQDIDNYWGAFYPKPRFFNQFIFEEDFNRSFYTLRNHAYFDKFFWRTNKFIYYLNKFIFMLIILILCVRYNKINRFLEIKDAIRLGENGDLGVKSEHSIY